MAAEGMQFLWQRNGGTIFLNLGFIWGILGSDWQAEILTLVADDNLHFSGKVYTPWGDTIVPLAELALLKEETPWRLVPRKPMTLWCSTNLS